jgi:hypothetical protein
MRNRHKRVHKGKYNKAGYTRKKFHRSAGSAQTHESTNTKLLEQEIIAYLYQEKEPQNMVNIMNALSLTRSDRKQFPAPGARKQAQFIPSRKKAPLLKEL